MAVYSFFLAQDEKWAHNVKRVKEFIFGMYLKTE